MKGQSIKKKREAVYAPRFLSNEPFIFSIEND